MKHIWFFFIGHVTSASFGVSIAKPRDYGTLCNSAIYNFNHSTYYTNEMGPSLKRMFITFKELIPPEEGYKTKHLSSNIEKKFSQNNKRNIKPYLLTTHSPLCVPLITVKI